MHQPLVSTAELAEWIDAGRKDLRVVDARWYLGQPIGTGRAAFEKGHIPGAIHVDLDTDLVATSGPGRHPLPDPSVFVATMGRRGVGNDDLVVIYDDVGGWVAARLWWMLDDLGFGDGSAGGGSAVLDGGIQAWLAEGRALSIEPHDPPPAMLHLRSSWGRVVDRAKLTTQLGTVVLLDARAGPRYRGEIEPIDPTPGHIPTALNAPVDGNLGTDGRFLQPSALADRFGALRLEAAANGFGDAAEPARSMVTSCGSGVSACHNALAMRIAGLPSPILYPGSYSDWSTAGEPVVVGQEPGRAPGS
ncbi:MAG: sulfurtransferase [Chloroflexota bacterium]